MENNDNKEHLDSREGIPASKKKKNPLAIILLIIAVVGVICAATLIILNELENKRQQDNIDAIQQDAYSTPEIPDEPNATPIPTPEPVVVEPKWYDAFARTPDREINFTELRSKNPDIYAWISIPGLEIDYPMVHTFKFDETYLSFDAYLQENKMGAIFTDGWNLGDFSDRVTFIYGHNMKSGTMFAGLHRFRDAVFFDEYDTIKIYIDDAELDYKVFAAYITTNEHVLMQHDFTDDEVYRNYLEEIFQDRDLSSNFRDVDLTIEDRIITLCTCVKDHSDQRLFVQAVLMPNE